VGLDCPGGCGGAWRCRGRNDLLAHRSGTKACGSDRRTVGCAKTNRGAPRAYEPNIEARCWLAAHSHPTRNARQSSASQATSLANPASQSNGKGISVAGPSDLCAGLRSRTHFHSAAHRARRRANLRAPIAFNLKASQNANDFRIPTIARSLANGPALDRRVYRQRRATPMMYSRRNRKVRGLS
jgi:hypothetical protein